MTVALTGSGSLGVRLGHIYGGMSDVLALRGGTATARVLSGGKFPSRVISTISPDFSNGTAIPQVINGLLTSLTAFQQAMGTMLTDLALRAKNTLLSMYAIDQQGASSTGTLAQLTTGFTVSQALTELIRQMTAAGTSVQGATVSAGSQTAIGTPTGNAIIVMSVKNKQGLTLQLPFPETIIFKCSNDSQTGSATSGNETMTVLGQAAVSDKLSQLWPGGSGLSTTLSAIDGSVLNSASSNSGNMLENSDFKTSTTANNPDNWTLGVGTAGTDVFQTTTAASVYTTGGGSIEFLGTGGALLDGVTQSFGVAPSTVVGAGGTSATLKASTVYHGVLFYKLTAASPSTGALQISLTDGSTYPGTVINNDQAVANTTTQVLTGVADTSWHSLSFTFQTPTVMPTTTPVAKIRLRLSTAIESTKGVFVGRMSLAEATQLYAGGPFVSVHSGNTRMIAGITPDQWSLAVSNSYSTTGSGLFQQFMERVFSLRDLGLQLPYASSSPTIDDALII